MGINGPLLGITVNSCPMSRGDPSVDSKAKLKLISNLPLFLREQVCLVSSNTLRTPKSRPPSAPMKHTTMKERKGTLFKCHVISRCGTHWGQCKLKWVLRRGENRSTRGKTAQSRVEKQQTQPTYDVESGHGIRATLMGGEYFHHCATTALHRVNKPQ